MEQIPIDRIIYQTLENIFEGQVKRLAIDIAKTLSVDVKPLIQSIRKDKITTYLYEEDHDKDVDDMKCKSYVKDGALYSKCSNPIIFKKDYCPKHLIKHNDVIPDSEELFLICGEDKKEYYIDSKKKIYDRNLNVIHGRVDEEEKILYIFSIDS
jgi:hypothetical protein